MEQIDNCVIRGCDRMWDIHIVEISNRRRISENFYCEEHSHNYLKNCYYSDTPCITQCMSRLAGACLADLKYIIFDHKQDRQELIISEANGTRNIILNIGYFEASILYHSTGVDLPSRPPTHRAIVTIISCLGGVIDYVIIDRFALDGYYYSSHMCIRKDEKEIMVDIRPSDALSLAIYSQCPIFISEELLEEQKSDCLGRQGDFR